MKRFPVSPLALFLLCLAATAPHAALAANTFPDWVVQASGTKLPSYPSTAGAVVLLDDRLVTVAPDGRATIIMPHPERCFMSRQLSWHPTDWDELSPWFKIFQNARAWVEDNQA